MPNIPASYASPNLRWALLLEDHPHATQRFDQLKGSHLGLPARYGAENDLCVATITVPDRGDFVGYKPLDDVRAGDVDAWNLTCSKALGRALKRAGYPDDLLELKAIIAWRRRNAEIDAIRSGTPPGTDADSQLDRDIEQAAADPDAPDRDDNPPPQLHPRVASLPVDPQAQREHLSEQVVAAGLDRAHVSAIAEHFAGQPCDPIGGIPIPPLAFAHTISILRHITSGHLVAQLSSDRDRHVVFTDAQQRSVELHAHDDGTVDFVKHPAEAA